jgi:predicted AlkP superfamily phosphohydrolase/phosphomutase
MQQKKSNAALNLFSIIIIVIVLGVGIMHYWDVKDNPSKNNLVLGKSDADKSNLTPEQILKYAQNNHNKVVVIGLDGATWKVILPLLNQGKLPNIQYLIEHGTFGSCKSVTEFPLVSPAIWTSIVTGKKQNKHGIEGFVIHLPGGYEQVPVTSEFRKVKAIWNILSDYKKTVGTVEWFVTRPPEKVNGFMASVNSTRQWFTYPETLAEQLDRLNPSNNETTRITSYPYIKHFELSVPFGTQEFTYNYTLRQIMKYQLRDSWTFQADIYLYQKYQPDFFATYFPWIDTVSHLTWKYYEPISFNAIYDITTHEKQWFGNIIPIVYEEEDAKIGRLLKVIPKNATVIIVSDHGFQAFNNSKLYRWTDLNLLLSELGYLKKNNQGVIDWSQTQAYELEDYYRDQRICYLNLKGREAQGIVSLESAATVRDAIVNDLTQLTTTSGKKVFANITKADWNKPDGVAEKNKHITAYQKTISPYSGDFYATANPALDYNDLIIFHDKQIPAKHFIAVNPASGDHQDDGIIIISGPQIKRKNVIRNASVLDVTPTVLYLMGLPMAKDMDGKILIDAIDPEYSKNQLFGSIPTYENNVPIQRIVSKDTTTDAEMLERLRALGYIGK